MQVFFRTPQPHFLPCSSGIHEGPCLTFAIKDFFLSLFLYVKIYLSIYSLPLVLFRTKNLFTKTQHSLQTLLKNSIVSALFLSVDASIIKYALCVLRNVWGKPQPFPHVFSCLAGFLGVAGLLIERESRRLELFYYVLPQVR